MEHRILSDPPLVSAIVPAYNAEAYIEQTLHSLLAQSYGNLEIIVVDDGSTDGTAQRVEAVARDHAQLRLIRQANQGVAAARNRGIRESRGEFIAPVDADDIWFPEAVTKLADCLITSDRHVGVVYGWSVVIDNESLMDGRFRCSRIEGNVLPTLICHNFIGNASSTMIRRDCIEKMGGYDERFRTGRVQGCEDWDLYLRIAQSYHFRVVPEFLIAYRRLPGGMSSNIDSMVKSHQRVLQNVKRDHPRAPEWIFRLSTNSYFLYLAYDCHHHKRPKESFRWLGRALAQSPSFTLLRLVFYLLVLKNLRMTLGLHPEENRAVRPVIHLQDIQNSRARIAVKTFIENALHRLATRMSLS